MAKEKDDLFSIRAAVEDVKAVFARQGEQVCIIRGKAIT